MLSGFIILRKTRGSPIQPSFPLSVDLQENIMVKLPLRILVAISSVLNA